MFGNYLASMLIAFSFVPMICAFAAKGKTETKAAGNTAIAFAGMYAVVILLVYFTQVTTVRLEVLNEQAKSLIDYTSMGLFFSFDLLGYCLMALSTFFTGMTIKIKRKSDKVLKWFLIIHGVFAIGCFIVPILGVFSSDMQGADWIGTAILEFWCVYFVPVGVLSFVHFKKDKSKT
jgi:multidrug efflux pump subunit AcrB